MGDYICFSYSSALIPLILTMCIVYCLLSFNWRNRLPENSNSNVDGKKKKRNRKKKNRQPLKPTGGVCNHQSDTEKAVIAQDRDSKDVNNGGINSTENNPTSSKARVFTYQSLVAATENFKEQLFLCSGGVMGDVYKGFLADTNEAVKIIQVLSYGGPEVMQKFMALVLRLSQADHPNVEKFIGYCAEGGKRLLVFEDISLGSLQSHLHEVKPNQKVLDWDTRMKIAAGVARGLEYFHDKMKPPAIHYHVMPSNILLGEGYHPKIANCAVAEVDNYFGWTHFPCAKLGHLCYFAPEITLTRQFTMKCDTYSFGVILLEMITGRRSIERTDIFQEPDIVVWVRPHLKDKHKLSELVDPVVNGQYSTKELYEVFAITEMCLMEQPSLRPPFADVVVRLNALAAHKYDA